MQAAAALSIVLGMRLILLAASMGLIGEVPHALQPHSLIDGV